MVQSSMTVTPDSVRRKKFEKLPKETPNMETDAPSQETDASEGLSAVQIALLVISIFTLLFGSGIVFRLRKYIMKKICKHCCQGGTGDTRRGSVELEAIEGMSDSLLNNTSNQATRISTGASGSAENVTEADQRSNHQGEIDRASEGRTTDQGPGSIEQGVNDSSLNLTSNQSSGSSGNLTITKTGAPTNVIYGNQYIHNHYHGLGGAAAAGGAEGEGGRIDKQTAESRAGNVETSQSSLPSAGSAAEAESKAVNMETSL